MHDASSESDGGGRSAKRAVLPPSAFAAGARGRSSPRSGAGALALGLAVSLLACACHPRRGEEAVTTTARPLSEVLAAHTPELMKVPGVVGTAESRLEDGRPCILVLVVRLTPELRQRIPSAIEGWPVRVQETGEIHAMPDSGG